jgi:hypothetical protein
MASTIFLLSAIVFTLPFAHNYTVYYYSGFIRIFQPKSESFLKKKKKFLHAGNSDGVLGCFFTLARDRALHISPHFDHSRLHTPFNEKL